MPLAEFQAALGSLVSTRASAQSLPAAVLTAQLQLTASEREWLEAVVTAPGFQVTCAIQRWWRETRLRSLARLTIAALGPSAAAQMLADYLHKHVCASLFFLPETLGFLQFVSEAAPHPHVTAIARFERTLLLAQEAAAAASNTSEVTYIEFAAPPAELIAAVLQGQPLPELCAERFLIAVSPTLPHFWQPVVGAMYNASA
jgi:hypothetical protein